MNQEKIGNFLRTLRKEKNMTQEELAHLINVTNRSVSRWETGSSLPDLDVLIELADFYQVDIRELLDGERKQENKQEINKDTIMKISSYSHSEKQKLMQKIHYFFIIGIISMMIYLLLETNQLTNIKLYDGIASYCLGISFGVILCGALFTSKYMYKINEMKMKLVSKK